ncbi:hypothetical protein Z043_111764 [Scleropages formosus]|uniref:Ras-associating and dilute domain-containing protein-like n=1 Tax=Scleropages formosus TaxID=113540 RepID=A0A0P7WZ28_SCLFO|nr:hypothetical protein Z043_111764 [Scleropages formosus]
MVFDHPLSASAASDHLMAIQLGTRVAPRIQDDLAYQRRTGPWSASSKWPLSSTSPVWDQLPPPRLNPKVPIAAQEIPQPVHLGQGHLTPEERPRRIWSPQCFDCGGACHFRANCPREDPPGTLVRESRETLLSAAVLDKEEGVSVLEEVIFYTFQQSVYHITKSLYTSLMGLLDQTPGHTEGQVPESVLKVLKVFQTTQSLLQQCQVHPEVQSQMFAYLFFFSNASLFNQLLDKGPVRGWFCTSSGLQFKTNLRKVLDWTRGAGLSCPAGRFLAKLRCAVSILATPIQQLTQMSWKALRAKYPALKPAQLHYIVTQCLLGADMGPGAVWQPTTDEEVHNYRTADLLESFEDHPPIVLPTSGFQVDLESDTVDDSIYRQLLYVRHFVWSLRSKSPSTMGNTDGPVHQGSKTPDATCLPIPPTTPSCPDTEPRLDTRAAVTAKPSRANGLIVSEIEVELDKGPFGLGLGLIDGLQTPLRSPGIYIRTLIPGGPASSNGRLRVGDRILAVNGTDVTGSNYQSAVDLIRWGGGKLNLLVEKKDPEVSAMIRASLC